MRASRDRYRVLSPEAYLRGDGWDTEVPGDGIGATEGWDRPTVAWRSAGSGCERRRIRPWLLASAGGLGLTGGLLAVLLQLRAGAGAAASRVAFTTEGRHRRRASRGSGASRFGIANPSTAVAPDVPLGTPGTHRVTKCR